MSEHTPEPWATAYRERRDGQRAQEIFDADGELIATLAWYSIKSGNSTHTNREENARRIVACVNACRGYNTEDLEDAESYGVMALRICQQRDVALHERDQATGIREIVEHQRDTALRERDEALAMVKELELVMTEACEQFFLRSNGPVPDLSWRAAIVKARALLAQA